MITPGAGGGMQSLRELHGHRPAVDGIHGLLGDDAGLLVTR